MNPVKIAIATAGLCESLRDAITLVSESGAEGVQLDVRTEVSPVDFGESACRQLLHNFGERGLKIASTTFPLRRPLYDAEQLDGRIGAVKDAMRLSARLKCRTLTLRIGRIPDESQDDAKTALRDALNDLARFGSREGVTLAIATVGDSAETLRNTIAGVTEGPIQVDFDPVGCISSQLDPIAMLKSLHDLIGHVQGRDAVRDMEMGGHEVTLGRGETPWGEAFAILDDAKYAGWVTVRRTTGNARRSEVANAVAYLRRIAEGG